jgi:AraC-like DNA-binding protein
MNRNEPTEIPVYRIEDRDRTLKSANFHLVRLEQRAAIPTYPHRHDCYQIIWVTHGGGRHIIDSTEYPVHDNVVFFLSPRQIHDLRLPRDATGYSISFSAEFFMLEVNASHSNSFSIYRTESPARALRLSGEQAVRLQSIVDEMEQEYLGEVPACLEIIGLYLRIFLTRASHYAQDPETTLSAPHSIALTRQFKTLLETDLLTIGPLQRYAERLHVTERHLSEATKVTTGLSATQLMHRYVVLEAKRMLAHSPLNVTCIAARLGFEDPCYFSRFFKKHVGQQPREFKRNFSH